MKRLRVIAMAACGKSCWGSSSGWAVWRSREPGDRWGGLVRPAGAGELPPGGGQRRPGGGEHRPGRHAAVRTGEGRAVCQAQARHREGVSGRWTGGAGQNRHPGRGGAAADPFRDPDRDVPPSGSPGRAAALAGSGPAAGGGGNGARALPPGDLPRGNGRGRPAAGVGGAACGAAGDQRRQAAAIPAAPLPPGGGGAGNGGPAGPRLQRGCFSGGHRHGGSGSEADRPAAGGAPAQAGGGRGGHCGERPGAGHPADLRGPADSGDRSGERGGAGCLPTGPLSSSRDGPRRSAWQT